MLGDASEEEQTLAALEALLKTRLEAARKGSRSSATVDEIVDQVFREEEKS